MDHKPSDEEIKKRATALANEEIAAMEAFLRTLDIPDEENLLFALSLARQMRIAVATTGEACVKGKTCAERWHVGVCAIAALLKSLQESKFPAFVDSLDCDCERCKQRKEAHHARI